MDAVARLLCPRSVAIVGASADPKKTSGRPVSYLRKFGFQGAIYPVNPRVEQIDGLPCFPDISSLPEAPDVAIVLLGAERTVSAVRDLAQLGTQAAIVLASGFAETGEEGARRQRDLAKAAGTMRLLGPNTIGLVNLTDKIILSASGALEADKMTTGSIGVVSQSGGILGSLLSRAAARGIGLSKLISTSNEVDLDLADFTDYLAEDDATSVIALYMETVRDVEKFRRAALKAADAGKPLVVYKIGRSEFGAQSAVSHTGAMAGEDRMYDALFRQVGAIRAETFGDLLDLPTGFAARRKLRGSRVAILTSTGGAGTLVADSLGVAGMEVPPPDSSTAETLRGLQDGDHAVLDRNPIDVTLAGLQPDLLRGAISALLASPSYNALVVVVGSSALAMPELMLNAIQDCLSKSDKPLIAYVSPHAPELTSIFNERGVPALVSPESCASVLGALWARGQWRPSTPAPYAFEARPLNESYAGSLDEAQAKRLFASFGIPASREHVVHSSDDAVEAAISLGPKVVLKILSAEVTHKSDIGGVAVGLGADDIGARFTKMSAEVTSHLGRAPESFLVQEMISGGLEMILGLRRDSLGTAILLGMGGVTAELFRDTALRLLMPGQPLSRGEALELIHSLKTWPLLDGYRGRPKHDVDALVSAIVSFSTMAIQLGERLVEAEINPLFVLAAGAGVRAADGVALFKET
jgi:acyl-CoA synthetase (NDP forming)